MRTLFILLFIAATACNNHTDEPKGEESLPKQSTVKHTAQLDRSINTALDNYYALTDAFVQWDSLSADKQAASLKINLDSIHLDELKNDSANFPYAQGFLDGTKRFVQGLLQQKDITGKRHSLDSLSNNLFQLLQTLQYSQSKLYLQECPMAFNDEEPGVWISKTASIRNPYMGLHHPRYQGAMIGCGETKDTLNFKEAK